MKKKQKVHLICNAHLDPVWLWEWQEGAAEAISTFRTAADLCEETKGFVFNKNEAILYQWIEEYDPVLFKRIQKLVKKGVWHIMGGWFLQPDCNMPSGESFVRHILVGRTYFKNKFGVDVSTAINFDPFGHTRGLVQILAKSGYHSYLFGRPFQNDCPLPDKDFIWIGFDGSEVLAHRFCNGDDLYNSGLGKARQKIETWLVDQCDRQSLLIPWGVGNHGGGPSRIDLQGINNLIRQRADCQITHSTPQRYFEEVEERRATLPSVAKSLNAWATGCYSSMIRIKQKHRKLENMLYAVEKMSAAAWVSRKMAYPEDEIVQAQRDLMIAQFHDILPGSSSEPVEEASLQTLDHGLEILSRVQARAFFALASNQKPPRSGRLPIMVYNPHPYPVRQIIECELNLPEAKFSGSFTRLTVYSGTKAMPTQIEQESSYLKIDWRKRVVFEAELKPYCVNRFECKMEVLPKKPLPQIAAKKEKISFKTKSLEIIINTATGLIDRYCVHGIDLIKGSAGELLVMQDNEDAWEQHAKKYDTVVGRFTLASAEQAKQLTGSSVGIGPVNVIEDGAVRTVVESLFVYNNSFACQRYKLPKSGTEIEIETRLFWFEKDKMLKLAIPTAAKDAAFLGQVAFGREEMPADGSEVVAQQWVAVVDNKKNTAMTCINSGTYSFDYSNAGLRCTLLRSPVYACGPIGQAPWSPQNRFVPRIDQGQRLFRFFINGEKPRKCLETIDRLASVKNEKPYALSFFPSGKTQAKNKSFIRLSDSSVIVSAVKKSQVGNDLIIRLFESTGRARQVTVYFDFIPRAVTIKLNAFEIKTLRVKRPSNTIREVNCIEGSIELIDKSVTVHRVWAGDNGSYGSSSDGRG